MKQLTEIKQKLRKHKPLFLRKYAVKELGVFGSYVRKEQKKHSDIDILVDFHEAPGLFQFIELENVLSNLLGNKVDLVMKRALKPIIGRQILSEVMYI